MNKQTLITTAEQVFKIAVRNVGNVDCSRAQVKSAALAAIAEVGATGMAASFAANYTLSSFGFGGGM